MIEGLPVYIVIVFILTTLISVGLILHLFKKASFSSKEVRIVNFIIPFGLFFHATAAIFGFYKSQPAFIPLFGVLPAVILIALLFLFGRDTLSKLHLQTLTFIQIVRIPVELCLFWLYQNKQIPQIMTFEGRNFDILVGITAPLITWLAFRKETPNRILLILWNFAGLGFLFNIVSYAALSLQTPLQKFGFDQPNQGVLYFPFIWLPAIIVPIALFCHLASLYQIFVKKA